MASVPSGSVGILTLLQKIPRALHIDNDEYVNSVNISSGEAWYDGDGDIVMFDAEDRRAVGWTGEDMIVVRTGGTSSEDVD